MFFQPIIRSQRHKHNNMFSFLNTGDINNTIRAITNLPGLFTSDSDKIKYTALNYATAMRRNLHDGVPIFTNIRPLEAEIERRDIQSIVSGRLPSAAAAHASEQYATTTQTSHVTNNEIQRDNATLALIMAKELAFLNRTIQMVSLIARRYQEEQEDAECVGGGDLEEGGGINGGGSSSDDDDDSAFEDDNVSSVCPLQRSSSSPTCAYSHHRAQRRPENQLVATFLVATGNLYNRFNNLCRLIEASTITVNAMTTQDKPHTEETRKRQLLAEHLVISDIFMNFEKYDAEHRNPVVWAFIELRDISVTCWKILSMFAFSNLFRLTEGTDFARMYRPEDAIFTQGRDYKLTMARHEEQAAVAEWTFRHNTDADADAADADADADAVDAVDADAAVDADEVPSSAGGGGYTFEELNELVSKHDAEVAAVTCEEDNTLYD